MFNGLRARYSFQRCIQAGLSASTDDAIRRALRAARARPTESFQRWASIIEARRKSLLNDPRELDVIDLRDGSGSDAGYRMTVSERARASKDPHWCRFLFELCATLRPTSALEMGSCVGVSASYLGAAMEDAGHGQLVTIEGDPSAADITKETLRINGITRVTSVVGAFQSVLVPVARDIAPIDLLFIDGHHDGPATIDYFDMLRPYIAQEGVVIFDDISHSDGMQRAWRKISESMPSIDLRRLGIVRC